MTDNIFYVYQYITKDGSPYYIGKGKEDRIHRKHKHVKIPPIEQRQFIEQNMTEVDALTLEMLLIRKHGRKIDGGLLDNTKLNQWACTTGWKHSEETKKIISEKNKGKKRTKETIEKYRLNGLNQSAEVKQKIRMANLGRKDDGRNSKISATKKGKPWSDARRNAQLNKQKKIGDRA
jgi:hypothetical protein